MATGEDKSLTGPNRSASNSSSSSQNECDEIEWTHPNSWDVRSHSKPTRKLPNKTRKKIFVQEAIAANVAEGFSSNSSFQTYPRHKCNAASWLKDEKIKKKVCDIEVNSASTRIDAADKTKKKKHDSEVNTASWLMDAFESDKRTRKKTQDSEGEVFSDTELFSGGMNRSVSHTVEDTENPEILRSYSRSEELQAVVNSCKKSETMSDKLTEALSHGTLSEKDLIHLLQQLVSGGFKNSNLCAADYRFFRELGESTHFSSEENDNKFNNLLDKMKKQEEEVKLRRKQREKLLFMQKKKKEAESMLSSYQETLNIDTHEENRPEAVRSPLEQIPCSGDQAHSSSNLYINSKDIGEQKSWENESLQGAGSEEKNHVCNLDDIPDLSQIQMGLDRIKKQVLLMQQNSNIQKQVLLMEASNITGIKNRSRSPSPDDSDFDEGVARVEVERKKLKNKLLELEEKKCMHLKLLQELTYLREHTDDTDNEDNRMSRRNSQRVHLKETQKAKTNRVNSNYHKLQTTLHCLDDLMKAMYPEENDQNDSLISESSRTTAKRDLRNIRSGSSMKRDNVRKDINSGFPARRHYEAEGRANEDADIPAASSNQPSAVKKKGKINSDKEEMLRKAEEAQKRFSLFNDLLTSLQVQSEKGKHVPLDHKPISPPLDNETDSDPWMEHCSSDSEEDFVPTIPERKQSDETTTVKEICFEGSKSSLENHEEVNASSAVPYNLELSHLDKDYALLQHEVNQLLLLQEQKHITNKKKDVSTIKHELSRIIQGTIEGRNSDAVRSSGEGGYVPNRNPDSLTNPTVNRQILPMQCDHQDNLLTRQNIATMESQCTSRNVHNRSSGIKKDNINNLSGKMGKISIQNAVNGPFSQDIDLPKDNLDSISINSSDRNQSYSEIERKTIRNILRNQDNQVFSNSSIESEMPNCTEAGNTTAAATWGGSSSHEIYQDENEQLRRNIGAQLDMSGVRLSQENTFRPASKRSRTSRREPMQKATSGSVNDEIPRSLPGIDGTQDNRQQMAIFILQLKKHIDQLNCLCQEKLNDLQTSMNFHSNSSQNLLQASPFQTVPDSVQAYNQQLLLCLSQCYQNLYLQQLEIQHLQRCLRHNIDTEALHQASNVNPQSNNDEFVFRPWCLSASNSFTPSELYSNEQGSPKSVPANFLPFPYKPCSSPSATSAGIRPVQAVIHPANHGNTNSHETLNNQVPPHTRANNFLDNFRSYSRQNMLSTSNNIKRNENIGLPVAPQIRQVHPMVSNEGLFPETNSRTYASASLETGFNSSFVNPERSLPNSCLQDIMNRSKKPNANTQASGQSRYSVINKKGTFSNITTSDDRNIRSERHQEHENGDEAAASTPLPNSSSNLVQLYPILDEGKIGNFSPVYPTPIAESVATTSDARIHSQGESDNNSDFLHNLYQEAKSLNSYTKRQQALDIIRDLAISEKRENVLATQCKVQNDHPSEINFDENLDLVAENSPLDLKINTADLTDLEKPLSRVSESSVPWTNQNLPTAAISPLSKQATSPSTSTGAIRKKTKLHTSSFCGSASSSKACSNSQETDNACEELDDASLQPIRENDSSDFKENNPNDFTEDAVVNILFDIQKAFPFEQMREESSMSFWCSINAYIINRIRAYMNAPLPHKSLALLRHHLDRLASQFLGKRICDCKEKFMTHIFLILYESIACFMATGKFTDSPSFASSSDSFPFPKPNARAENLCMRISASINKVYDLSVNRPSDAFSSHPPVYQQNASLNASDASDDATANSHQVTGVMAEASSTLECGPEADAEPEVEAGTEADLAEADQSPGQGNISSSMSTAESGAVANSSEPITNEEMNIALEEDVELISANHAPDGCVNPQEIALDDVPIKLSPTEEEPQKLEEVPVYLSSSDDSHNNELLSESNNCESEVTSTK